MTLPPSPSTVIIRPKIRAPRVRPQLVVRKTLVDRLNAGWWRKLTLVCAQPGSGKTTLLSYWAGQLTIPTAWLTLDENDNAVERFLAHLTASIDAAQPGTGKSAFSLLNAPQPLDAQQWITLLVNDIDQNGQPLVLVMDDYHTINHVAIHEAVQYLLDQLPEPLHLVIATRSDPPLPLARLRARDQLTELRNDDLRFSVEEAADFLNRVMDLGLAPAEIDALERQTEGWVTGLQLAALALQAPLAAPASSAGAQPNKTDPAHLVKLLSGSSRYILDYLTEEVLRRQPEDIQAFLLDTSILERMHPALCQAVTGRADSAALLRQLEQAHLFILPLDDENEWYRYHTLFAELLRYQLERSQPERAAALRAKAAQWLEAQGYSVEALNQHLHLKDYPQAARLAQKEGHQLLVQGQAALFNGWFNSLPEAVFKAMPRLYLVQAFGLISMGQFASVEARLGALEQLFPNEPPDSEIFGEIAATRAIIASTSGRHQEAIEQSQRALDLLPGSSPMRCSILMGLGSALNFTGRVEEARQAMGEAARLALINHQYSVVFSALCNKGNIERTQGKLRQALSTFQGVIDSDAALPERSPVVAMAHLGLGGLYAEWNDLEKAEASVQAAIPLSDQWGYAEMRAMARGHSALIRLLRGDAAQAARLIEQMEEIIRQSGITGDPSGFLYAPRLEYLVQSGQMKAALQTAGELPTPAEPAVGLLPPHDLPMALARAKAWLAHGTTTRSAAHLAQVQAFYERIQAAAEQYGQQAFLIEARIGQALALAGQGKEPTALTALEQALALGAPEGYLRLFVGFGAPVAALLRRWLVAAPGGTLKVYAQRLLDAFDAQALAASGAVAPSQEPAPGAPTYAPTGINAGLVEPLSEREIEVLRLVAEGLSNQEIADRLTIAQGTVKRHLHNIFEKLGVSTRPQAIAMARKNNV